jgi:hypothetical protein
VRQAIHILRKDIRYLWIEILATLVAVGLFIFTAAQSPLAWNAQLPRTIASFLMQFLLPFAWWFLITRAIHAEPLIGDRQFWPTRPYAWQSLLIAKAMLFLLVVNLPMFIAQAIVIQLHGFSPLAELSGLLWNQLLLTLVVILPLAAVAAVTASIVQFLVIGLVAFVLMLLLSFQLSRVALAMAGGGWGPMEWIQNYFALLLVAVAAPAILIWQYSRRLALPARIVACAAVVGIVLNAPISWATGFALQARVSPHRLKEPAVYAGFNSNFQWMTRALIERDGRVGLHVPLQLSGVPDDATVRPEGLSVTIEGAGGAVWRAPAEFRGNISSTGQLISLQTMVDRSFYEKVKDQPVRLHGNLYVTLYGNRHVSKLPFTNQPTTVPGMGICVASSGKNAPYFLTCDSVFRPQATLSTVQFEEIMRGPADYTPNGKAPSYSPFPAEFAMDPVHPFTAYSTYKGPLDAVTITSLEPLAHVKVPLRIDGLKLVDYEKKL